MVVQLVHLVVNLVGFLVISTEPLGQQSYYCSTDNLSKQQNYNIYVPLHLVACMQVMPLNAQQHNALVSPPTALTAIRICSCFLKIQLTY